MVDQVGVFPKVGWKDDGDDVGDWSARCGESCWNCESRNCQEYAPLVYYSSFNMNTKYVDIIM